VYVCGNGRRVTAWQRSEVKQSGDDRIGSYCLTNAQTAADWLSAWRTPFVSLAYVPNPGGAHTTHNAVDVARPLITVRVVARLLASSWAFDALCPCRRCSWRFELDSVASLRRQHAFGRPTAVKQSEHRRQLRARWDQHRRRGRPDVCFRCSSPVLWTPIGECCWPWSLAPPLADSEAWLTYQLLAS
jgi:hypothetical protein